MKLCVIFQVVAPLYRRSFAATACTTLDCCPVHQRADTQIPVPDSDLGYRNAQLPNWQVISSVVSALTRWREYLLGEVISLVWRFTSSAGGEREQFYNIHRR